MSKDKKAKSPKKEKKQKKPRKAAKREKRPQKPKPGIPRSRVKALPVAIGSGFKAGNPAFQSVGKGSSIVVRHRELFSPLVSNGWVDGQPGGHFLTTYAVINPGLSDVFPWLSKIANSWEYYKVRRYTLHFIPSRSVATDGVIRLAADPDVQDQAPNDISEMFMMKLSTEGNVWNSLTLTVTPAVDPGANRLRYVSATWPPVTRDNQWDAHEYLSSNIYVSLSGIGADVQVGHLVIDYEFEFHTPNKTDVTAPAAAHFDSPAGDSNALSVPINLSPRAFQVVSPNTLRILQPGLYQIVFDGQDGTGMPTMPIMGFSAGIHRLDWPLMPQEASSLVGEFTYVQMINVVDSTTAQINITMNDAAVSCYKVLSIIRAPNGYGHQIDRFLDAPRGLCSITSRYVEACRTAGLVSSSANAVPRYIFKKPPTEDVVSTRLDELRDETSEESMEIIPPPSTKRRAK